MPAVAQQLSHLAALPGNVAAVVGLCGFLREKNGTDTVYTWTSGCNFKSEVSSAGKYFLFYCTGLLFIKQGPFSKVSQIDFLQPPSVGGDGQQHFPGSFPL